MKDIRFEWDPEKEKQNRVKHGITFKEATTVFFDNWAILFDDPDHSFDEERFMIIGMSASANICTVSHCYREKCTVRIISARPATKAEEKTYQKYRSNNGKELQ